MINYKLMGFLRIFLAIIVVLSHSDFFGIDFIGGKSAVELFFIISGFYMSMILNTKYIGKNSYKSFISNRILRIYPIYFFVLISGIIISLTGGILIDNWGYLNQYITYVNILDLKTLLFFTFSNIFIIGQDYMSLLNINLINGDLGFGLPANNMMFRMLPQAWTLAVELSFYIIAPFIVRRKISYIILFIFLSLAFRIFVFTYLNSDYGAYLIYILFPSQLALFLLGSLSYRLYEFINNKGLINMKIIYIFFILIVFSDFFERLGLNINLISWIIYITSIFAIPNLFLISKNFYLDKKIGDLSYPIYITHELIIFTILGIISTINLSQLPNYIITIFVIILSIIISILLIKYIEVPINKIRQKNINNIKRF